MKDLMKKLPIPISGLMLALAAIGNLVQSYGDNYRYAFGAISATILILLTAKLLMFPKALSEGLENPVVASVIPTFSMGIMILSTYLKVFNGSMAFGLWIIGLVIHIILMISFAKKYLIKFNIKKVFPSYFVVYVGIVVASVTAPLHNMASLGQAIFWFGFIAYLALLPFVIYRVFVTKEIPEPAIPTITIFAAPASLCLAGYLNSFQQKNIIMVGLLAILAIGMFISVLIYMPRMLRLKFYPSYSAFTFPFVISAIAVKGTNNFLNNIGRGITGLIYVVRFMEFWAVLMVLYVLVRYIMFLMPEKQPAIPGDRKVSS